MSTKHRTPAGGELKRVYDAWLPNGTCTAEMRVDIVNAARAAGIPGSEFMRRAVAFYLDANFTIRNEKITNSKEALAVHS
jgi:hypothetical protein